MVKISLDVMGAELGYKVPLKAAFTFCKEFKDVKFYFVGIKSKIEPTLKKLKFPKENYTIIDATQVITTKDGIISIRRKPDSSMVKSILLVKENQSDIVISGGPTGPFLAACHLFLKEMKGIDRPALMPLIPNTGGSANILLDVGATIDPKKKDLCKFASMASVYSRVILQVENPRVGLINIGEEETKGNQFQKDLYKELKADESINFHGNIEPRHLFSTKCDIFLTDGLSGNLILKTLEGTSYTILSVFKKEFSKNIFRKLGALMVYYILKKIKSNFNYKKYNGALVIGLEKPAFKTHGSSDEFSYYSVIKMAYKNVKNNVLDKIKEVINNENSKN